MTRQPLHQGQRADPADLLAAPDLASLEARLAGMFPDVAQISRDEFTARSSSGEKFVLLDVRRAAEHRVSHISGSRRVAPASRPQSVLRRLYPCREPSRIILYCTVGFRSSVLARRLRASGVDGCANLTGGIFGWVNDGRTVFNDQGETSGVHPYAADWQKFLCAPAPDRRSMITTA